MTTPAHPPSPSPHPLSAGLRRLGILTFPCATTTNTLTFGAKGTNGDYRIFCGHVPEFDLITMTVRTDIQVHSDRHDEAMRFLVSLNGRIFGGGFRVVPDTGEIVFRHCLHLDDNAEPTDGVVERFVCFALAAVDIARPQLAPLAASPLSGSLTCPPDTMS